MSRLAPPARPLARMRTLARAIEEKAEGVHATITGDRPEPDLRAEVADLARAVADLASLLGRLLETLENDR